MNPILGIWLLTVGFIMAVVFYPGAALGAALAALYAALRRRVPWHALPGKPLVFISLAAAAGQAATSALSTFGQLSHLLAFSFDLSAAALGGYALYLIVKGKLMPNIFDIASDPGALQAFISAPSQPAPQGEFLDLDGIDQASAIAAIQERVIGQDTIVQDLLGLVYRRAGLRRKNKPAAVVMLAGATGAGKTELAKALADVLAAGRMVRIDCNEMTESSSTQRLIGAPPGYMGSDQGGWLCRQLGEKRTGILLFDEIEKAHPDVFKLLMGLFDEGRMTEQSTGQTYSAQGFLIILTTNAEHARIAEIVRTEQDPQERAARVKDTLQTVFKPEQLARIDEVYSFGDLDRRAVAQIVGKFLFSFAADVGVTLERVDSALLIDLIARREKLKNYGIREVVRLVEKAVLDGMLQARADGHKAVQIVTDGDAVRVLPASISTNSQTKGVKGVNHV